MFNPLISVVVPCFNVEKYLPPLFKCINAQTYANLHVIFVDDGSTDETGNLLRAYCESHPQHTLIACENAGVASARNRGLDAVKGELCAFLDPDDLICENHFALLAENLSASGADMAVCGMKRVCERKALKFDPHRTPLSRKTLFFDKKQALEQFFSQEKFDFGLINKIFYSEIIKKSGARFLDGCRFGEESYFFFKYLSACEKTVFYGAKTYVYVQRRGSLTHSAFNESRLDVYKNIGAVINSAKESDEYATVLPYIRVMRAGYSIGILYFILRSEYRDAGIIANILHTLSDDLKCLKKCPKVALYKKLFLPPCALIAKIVYRKQLKGVGTLKEQSGVVDQVK